ncbi:hypothetical protein MIR68_011802 [Amoeboaphelidium protococcarum]|nr:hypothetical protein MIR68_011802 [Amoeboaphelidium protococcarum]
MSKEEVIQKLRSSRMFQHKSGSKEDDTEAAHVLGRAIALDAIEAQKEKLSKDEIVQMVRVIDQGTRIKQRNSRAMTKALNSAGNAKDSKNERALVRSIKNGETLNKENTAHVTKMVSFVLKNPDLKQKQAEILLDHVAKCNHNGASVMVHIKKNIELGGKSDTGVRKAFDQVYSKQVDDFIECVQHAKEKNITVDGVIDKRSALVTRGYVSYTQEKKVSKKCTAFKRGIIDEDGQFIKDAPLLKVESRKSVAGEKSKPSTGIGERELTQYSGIGRLKATDYLPSGEVNYGSPKVAPTIYQGIGRPRATDYMPSRQINYGNSYSSSSYSGSSSSYSSSQQTTYSGRGRPRNSDYLPGGGINYGR